MDFVVLCDFDNTVVDIDIAEFILARFSEADWQVFDEQLERGEITLEECMQKQFSTVKAPRALILKETENVTVARPNFGKLVEYCKNHDIPLIFVSAGLDFVIKRFINLNGWHGLIEAYTPKSKFTADGIKFTFPKLLDETSVSFKDDLVRHYKKLGKRVIYIGDGTPDYQAAREAHFSFVIKDSKLAELLRNEKILHKEISDFQEVVETIKASTFLRKWRTSI